MTTTISKHELQQQQKQHAIITTTTTTATTTATATTTEPLSGAMQLQFDTLNNNDIATVTVTASSDEPQPSSTHDTAHNQAKVLKRRSLLNFKSFDFHIKSLYSGLRSSGASGDSGGSNVASTGHKSQSQSQSRSSSLDVTAAATAIQRRIPPHLRIEGVDTDPDPEPESRNLLLDYSASPFTPRRNSSTQLLPINPDSSFLSPYYLSPYMAVGGGGAGGAAGGGAAGNSDGASGNIRRSSTSDIVNCRRRGSTASSSNSRRPSTSDLLRRARERRGSEARMGRSVSHSAMRGMGGGGGGGCMGGRRTSMAF